MRKKNTVLLLGIVSIVLLVSVQVFIVIKVWEEKNEMFSLRYTLRSQEASSYIWRTSGTDGFDTVRLFLNDFTDKIVDELFGITDQEVLNRTRKYILDYFNTVINQEQDVSSMLSSYFEMRGLEKHFEHSIIITNLEMIKSDTIIIQRDQRFGRKRPMPSSEVTSSKIFINRYEFEGNYYRISLDYYIDFTDKREAVMRETSATLLLSIISIVLVGVMFIITYRNLMEERRLSNLKTDFINNMTHELKTPLSTITVAGRTLEMPQIRTNEEKILETARMIGKQSIHLNQLINMILEISMWERTQFQVDRKKVDVEDLLRDVVESFKAGGGNSARISEKYNLAGVTADIDVVYFTTLLNNLLSNAVKYSNKTPEIDIEGFVSDESLHIKVADNGIGINKVDQKHIFDKFYRASSGNIHKFKGLGLGLYYVRKIAEAHGGNVSVNSKPGKGSTFTVTLPL